MRSHIKPSLDAFVGPHRHSDAAVSAHAGQDDITDNRCCQGTANAVASDSPLPLPLTQPRMLTFTTTLLLLTVILVCLPAETYAFGAGDIPDFAYLNGTSDMVPSRPRIGG